MKNNLIEIIQYLYKKLLFSFYLQKKIKIYSIIYFFWNTFLKKYDFETRVKIGKNHLFINLLHKLPFYFYNYQYYDRALPRISKKLKEIDKKLNVIDIGANIGDTLSLITDAVYGNFLCIEGDVQYLLKLKKNIELISKKNYIKVEECYCGNEIKNIFEIDRSKGTAKIVKKEILKNNIMEMDKIKVQSLDKIVGDNQIFRDANLLKIDTDGYEIDVLESGKNFIKESKPLIYFEFTPEYYKKNGHKSDEIWQILKECGYKKALFYDNFGYALEIVEIDNKNRINELVERIDKKNIYYYDILAAHDNKNYLDILQSEFNFFINENTIR